MNCGQQAGKEAVLLVFSSSSLHFGFARGSGPQSSTSSNNPNFGSSGATHVDLPQNGVKSHDCPTSTVAHLVLAKHCPGKSANKKYKH